MKYGLRAILLAHKVIKGELDFDDVPQDRLTYVIRYLSDKGHSDLIPVEDPEEPTDPTDPTEDPDDDEPDETRTKSASLIYTKSASDISNSTLAIITPKPPATATMAVEKSFS